MAILEICTFKHEHCFQNSFFCQLLLEQSPFDILIFIFESLLEQRAQKVRKDFKKNMNFFSFSKPHFQRTTKLMDSIRGRGHLRKEFV